jgi:hypothetical protein
MGEGESKQTPEDEEPPEDADGASEDEEQPEASDGGSEEEEQSDDTGDSAEDEGQAEDASGGRETVDISDTPAPSIGPHTTFDKRSAEERLSGHEQSDKDAMGLEKRRQVMGGRYSASFTRQIVTYVIVLGVIVGAAFGLKVLADDLDKPPAKVEDQAPWTGSDQKPTSLQ